MALFTNIIQPRFYETDALGHINNTMIPQWFETAREPIFRFFTPDLDPQKWRLIIANINVDFIAQLHYGHEVEIKTTILKVGNSSFVIGQEAWQKGNMCAKGTATLIHFDYSQQRSAPIPSDIREQLLQVGQRAEQA